MVLSARDLSDNETVISEIHQLFGSILDSLLLCFRAESTFAVQGASPRKDATIVGQGDRVEERASNFHYLVVG